uniref:Hyaluronan-mediated motility receptor C-terminal domain-containing protein n=1 Tax=Clastoptera arizonana TaxID=38151 RepID=A0A1B6DH35_9HEMI
MSFSKAKLHRFNDEIKSTPAPGRYNPTLDTIGKGPVIDKSKKCNSSKSVKSSTESLDSVSSVNNGKSSLLPVFRTPQLKRTVLKQPKPNNQTDKVTKSTTSKIVLSIENLREENKKLVTQISLLKDQQKLQCNNECRVKEEELENLISQKYELIKLNHENLQHLDNTLMELKDSFTDQKDVYSKYIEEVEKMCGELLLENDIMSDKYDVRIGKLQQEMYEVLSQHEEELKSISEQTEINLEVLNKTYSEIISKLIIDFNLAMKKLEESSEKISLNNFHKFESQIETLETNLQKSTQFIKELETFIKDKAEEFVKNIKETDEHCKFLYEELRRVEMERDDLLVSDLEKNLKIVENENLNEELKYNLSAVKERCKKLEVSLNKMQDTIKVLSERLFASESEVERLNDIESKLQSQNNALQENAKLSIQDDLVLKMSSEEIERIIVEDVSKVRSELLDRLEQFKDHAQKEIEYLKDQINIRDKDIINKTQFILDYTIKVDCLKDKNKQINQLVNILKGEKRDLEIQLFELTENQIKLENDDKEKEETIKDLESLVDSKTNLIRNQQKMIEYLENEVNQQKYDTMTVKYLNEQLEEKDKSLDEMEKKYREMARQVNQTTLHQKKNNRLGNRKCWID